MWLGDAAVEGWFIACFATVVACADAVVVEGDFKSVILATIEVGGECFVCIVNGGVMAPGVEVVGLAFVDPTPAEPAFLVVLGAAVDLGVFSLVPVDFAVERAGLVGAEIVTTDATDAAGTADAVDAEDDRGIETCSAVVDEPAEVGGVDSNDAGVELISAVAVVVVDIDVTIAVSFAAVVVAADLVSAVEVVLLGTAIVAVDVTVGVVIGVVEGVLVVVEVSSSFSFSIPAVLASTDLVVGFKLVALIWLIGTNFGPPEDIGEPILSFRRAY